MDRLENIIRRSGQDRKKLNSTALKYNEIRFKELNFLLFWAVVKDIEFRHVWIKFQFKPDIDLIMRYKMCAFRAT